MYGIESKVVRQFFTHSIRTSADPNYREQIIAAWLDCYRGEAGYVLTKRHPPPARIFMPISPAGI